MLEGVSLGGAAVRRLQHPNVVDLRHVMSTRTHIYLVLELVTGANSRPLVLQGSVRARAELIHAAVAGS